MYPEKNLSEQETQQTQPTFDAESGNRTRATMVGGLRGRQMLNHCAIPAPRGLLGDYTVEIGETYFAPTVTLITAIPPRYHQNSNQIISYKRLIYMYQRYSQKLHVIAERKFHNSLRSLSLLNIISSDDRISENFDWMKRNSRV